MKDLITLDDIARELKRSRKTVQRLVWTGQLKTITIPRRGGFTYVVPIQEYFDWKRNFTKKKETNKYLSDAKFLREQQVKWLEWCSNGALTGKPMADGTIVKNNWTLNDYWRKLPRRYRLTPLISIDCIRYVLSNMDPKSYSMKNNLYIVLRSFIKYLIKNGYCEKSLLDEIGELKPRRVYPPKKSHCTLEQFERLLAEAKVMARGQSNYNVILSTTIVALLGYAGLRGGELCNLRIQDVDIINRKIFVYLGKGKKNRSVGICKVLYEYLNEYLKARPKTELENFFVTRVNDSKIVPFDRHVLTRKIKRLAQRLNMDISPHGLRRTFATIAANSGKPINIISLALGHADLKTTQGYLMTSQEEVIKEMQNW